MIYLDLFLGFLIVGLFSFGGAYSSIPLIREVVNHFGWMNDELLSQMIAVSESTPGPIMVNLATYIGTSQGGILGAVVATFAVVLPAFVIVLVVAAIMDKFIKNKYVQAVLDGLLPCMIGIILITGIWMIIENVTLINFSGVDYKALIITSILALIYFGSKYGLKKKMSPILLIIIAAICGIVAYSF